MFKLNRGFGEELGKQRAYNEALASSTQPAAAAVRMAAPRETGAYARSISVVIESGEVRLKSSDPFAHLVEWGSAKNPPYAPLRRGIRAAGLRFKELGK
jgi:hypothetical protein